MNTQRYYKHKDQISGYVFKFPPLILCLTETFITENFIETELIRNRRT